MSQTSSSIAGYDVVGDVHGCATLLRRLLEKLNYQEVDGVFSHPLRKIIFLGDLVDRGSEIRDVVSIAKSMVESGSAYAVLGNHEYNALIYDRVVLRDSYRQKLGNLLGESLQQYKQHPKEWQQALNWFSTLPLYLELEHFRVVHACWDQPVIDKLQTVIPTGNLSDERVLAQSAIAGSQEHRIVERLLRGTDLQLPEGLTVTGSDGTVRRRFRTKFWTQTPKTYGDVVFQPDRLPMDVEDRVLTEDEKNQQVYYQKEAKPLFVGHYWRQGKPRLIRSNIACLDYSAVKQGKLVAYRFDEGDMGLDVSKLWWVK